jgi:hypothetical protein
VSDFILADTWHLNNRVSLMLLDHLTAGDWRTQPPA